MAVAAYMTFCLLRPEPTLGAHYQRAVLLLSSSLLSLCKDAGQWMLEMPIDNQDTLSLLV